MLDICPFFCHEILQITAEHLETLMSKVRLHSDTLCELSQTVSMLDLVTSFAGYVATNGRCIRPTFSGPSNAERFVLEGARHPIVEAYQDQSFVPLNFNVQHDCNVQVITAPNSAGKTTFLQTAGLLSIIAQMGCFVPAAFACIPIFRRLFTRMGTSDNIEESASTFLIETSEIANVLSDNNKDSLILIDELGRGTSHTEGLALAYAISEHLALRPSLTFFSTHFTEIRQLASTHPVSNVVLKVAPTAHGYKPLYTVSHQDNTASSYQGNYGIDLAEMVAFPKEVITHARQVAIDLEREDFPQLVHLTKYDLIEAMRDLRFLSHCDNMLDGLNQWKQHWVPPRDLSISTNQPESDVEGCQSVHQDSDRNNGSGHQTSSIRKNRIAKNMGPVPHDVTRTAHPSSTPKYDHCNQPHQLSYDRKCDLVNTGKRNLSHCEEQHNERTLSCDSFRRYSPQRAKSPSFRNISYRNAPCDRKSTRSESVEVERRDVRRNRSCSPPESTSRRNRDSTLGRRFYESPSPTQRSSSHQHVIDFSRRRSDGLVSSDSDPASIIEVTSQLLNDEKQEVYSISTHRYENNRQFDEMSDVFSSDREYRLVFSPQSQNDRNNIGSVVSATQSEYCFDWHQSDVENQISDTTRRSFNIGDSKNDPIMIEDSDEEIYLGIISPTNESAVSVSPKHNHSLFKPHESGQGHPISISSAGETKCLNQDEIPLQDAMPEQSTEYDAEVNDLVTTSQKTNSFDKEPIQHSALDGIDGITTEWEHAPKDHGEVGDMSISSNNAHTCSSENKIMLTAEHKIKAVDGATTEANMKKMIAVENSLHSHKQKRGVSQELNSIEVDTSRRDVEQPVVVRFVETDNTITNSLQKLDSTSRVAASTPTSDEKENLNASQTPAQKIETTNKLNKSTSEIKRTTTEGQKSTTIAGVLSDKKIFAVEMPHEQQQNVSQEPESMEEISCKRVNEQSIGFRIGNLEEPIMEDLEKQQMGSTGVASISTSDEKENIDASKRHEKFLDLANKPATCSDVCKKTSQDDMTMDTTESISQTNSNQNGKRSSPEDSYTSDQPAKIQKVLRGTRQQQAVKETLIMLRRIVEKREQNKLQKMAESEKIKHVSVEDHTISFISRNSEIEPNRVGQMQKGGVQAQIQALGCAEPHYNQQGSFFNQKIYHGNPSIQVQKFELSVPIDHPTNFNQVEHRQDDVRQVRKQFKVPAVQRNSFSNIPDAMQDTQTWLRESKCHQPEMTSNQINGNNKENRMPLQTPQFNNMTKALGPPQCARSYEQYLTSHQVTQTFGNNARGVAGFQWGMCQQGSAKDFFVKKRPFGNQKLQQQHGVQNSETIDNMPSAYAYMSQNTNAPIPKFSRQFSQDKSLTHGIPSQTRVGSAIRRPSDLLRTNGQKLHIDVGPTGCITQKSD